MKGARRSDLEPALDDPPQLLALVIAGILDLEVATLGGNLLGGEWPLGMSPPRIRPPLLQASNVGLVEGILTIEIRHWDGVHKRSLVRHDC